MNCNDVPPGRRFGMENTAPKIGIPQPKVLRNVTCVYCGEALTTETATKEHVVGRRFVPPDQMKDSWNLILRACRRCNGRKSDLEDDISAITMQPTISGDFPCADPKLIAAAERKGANSISRRTGKRVSESVESLTFTTPFMGVGTMTVGMISPPQVDHERAFELASFHIGAFFYFLTYDHMKNRGWFPTGPFHAVEASARGDWGSPLNRSFMSATDTWLLRLVFTGAGGFFRAAIRKHPASDCWSWAVEWNKNLRVIGFMGNPATVQNELKALTLNPVTEFTTGNETSRFRTEVPITENEDSLFALPSNGGGLISDEGEPQL